MQRKLVNLPYIHTKRTKLNADLFLKRLNFMTSFLWRCSKYLPVCLFSPRSSESAKSEARSCAFFECFTIFYGKPVLPAQYRTFIFPQSVTRFRSALCAMILPTDLLPIKLPQGILQRTLHYTQPHLL